MKTIKNNFGIKLNFCLLIVLSWIVVPVNIKAQWTQLPPGGDILGTITSESSGSSVAMNASGDIVVVGSPGPSDLVRVWRFIGGTWVSENITDGMPGWQEFGYAVDINDVGDIIAVGSRLGMGQLGYVQVFEYNPMTMMWDPISQMINATGGGQSRFGSAVSLDASGNTVAVGGPTANTSTGTVLVYNNPNPGNGLQTWTPVGMPLNGLTTGDFFGGSVSLSADGTVLAAGASMADPGFAGQVHVFEFDMMMMQWNIRDQPINGDNNMDLSGTAVALNATGDRVAISAPGYGSNIGQIRVFQWDGVLWAKVNSDIYGTSFTTTFGDALSINSAGDRLVVGAPGIGKTYIYEDVDPNWELIGMEISGPIGEGSSVDINNVGERVITGDPLFDGPGLNTGRARVFTGPLPCSFHLCGDCDGSGAINILDVLFAAKIASGQAPIPLCARRCDVNSVSGITILDALIIARYNVGLKIGLTCP